MNTIIIYIRMPCIVTPFYSELTCKGRYIGEIMAYDPANQHSYKLDVWIAMYIPSFLIYWNIDVLIEWELWLFLLVCLSLAREPSKYRCVVFCCLPLLSLLAPCYLLGCCWDHIEWVHVDFLNLKTYMCGNIWKKKIYFTNHIFKKVVWKR